MENRNYKAWSKFHCVKNTDLELTKDALCSSNQLVCYVSNQPIDKAIHSTIFVCYKIMQILDCPILELTRRSSVACRCLPTILGFAPTPPLARCSHPLPLASILLHSPHLSALPSPPTSCWPMRVKTHLTGTYHSENSFHLSTSLTVAATKW